MELNNRLYFDIHKNEIDKAKYYEILEQDDLDLFQKRVSALLTNSHKIKLPYNPSHFLYPIVDIQESGNLMSIYSGKEFSLSQILALDKQISKIRQSTLEIHLKEPNRSLNFEQIKLEVEAKNSFNCEHVVCQSWFDHKEPMKGDLHHLFTCEVDCNSFRNNNKYYDFPDYYKVTVDDCGKLENRLFEPERNKGILARAVFYFMLRYPNIINVYDSQDILMLKKWHDEESVTLYELHRNQQIFLLQGNRNPLIDFPAWTSRLTFL